MRVGVSPVASRGLAHPQLLFLFTGVVLQNNPGRGKALSYTVRNQSSPFLRKAGFVGKADIHKQMNTTQFHCVIGDPCSSVKALLRHSKKKDLRDLVYTLGQPIRINSKQLDIRAR